MRALLVTDWTANEGGIETYVARLRDDLPLAGVDCRLLTSSAGSAAGGSAEYVARASDRLSAQTGLQLVNPFSLVRLREAVREFDPDVVYINMFEKYLSPGVLWPGSRVATVAMVHYAKPVCPTATKLLPDGSRCRRPLGRVCVDSGCVTRAERLRDVPRYALIHRGLRQAESVLACSAWLARELAAVGVDAATLYPPVPPPSPSFRRHPAADPLFVYAGRLDREKGVDLLLRAFARLRRECPAARLRILGDGTRRAELEMLSLSLGVADAVDFAGRRPFGEVEAALARAWAVVSPSLWPEPFGLAAVEAIARGVPAIAGADGGHAETIEQGVSGLLFPNGDEDALAERLASVAGRRAFPSLAVRAAAVERARRRHDPRRHAAALRAIFQSAVRRRAARRR